MRVARRIFRTVSVLFWLLYSLMLMLFFEELKTEENPFARALDLGIIFLGIIFIILQVNLYRWVGDPSKHASLKSIFYGGLIIWFFLEIVLSYTWCFVTGADPIMEHTPFVVLFFAFNTAQYWAMKKLKAF